MELYFGDLNVLFEEAFEHFSDFLKRTGFLLHVKRPGNDPFFQETLGSDCMFCHCFSSSFVDTCFTEDVFKMFHFHTKKPVLFLDWLLALRLRFKLFCNLNDDIYGFDHVIN